MIKDIVTLFKSGKKIKEIAKLFGLSEFTIRGHIANHLNVSGNYIEKMDTTIYGWGEIADEKWKQINLPMSSRRDISNFGRIKSYARNPEGNFLKGVILMGYPAFGYYCPVKRGNVSVFIHQLVADAFLRKPKSTDMVITHLNHIKNDNHYKNLKWVSKTESAKLANLSPYVKMSKNRFIQLSKEGRVANKNRKLNVADVEQIKKRLHKGESASLLAKEFGVAEMTIYRIHNGDIWSEVLPELSRRKKPNKLPEYTINKIIKQILKRNMLDKDIAKKFKVNPTTIFRIKIRYKL